MSDTDVATAGDDLEIFPPISESKPAKGDEAKSEDTGDEKSPVQSDLAEDIKGDGDTEDKGPDPWEPLASSMGWKASDKWDDSLSSLPFQDAQEFVTRRLQRPMERKISRQQSTIDGMAQHFARTRSKEIEEAKKIVSERRAKAVADGDADAFEKADSDMEDIRKIETSETTVADQDANPAFEDWAAQNKWYTTDSELKEAADTYGQAIQSRNPGMSYEDILAQSAAMVKREFPAKFKNPRREDPASVEGSRPGSSQTPGQTWSDVPEEARNAFRAFFDAGTWEGQTEAEARKTYMSEYFEAEE